MIDILADGILTQVQQRLANLYPFILACISGCLGLGAFATVLALLSPSAPSIWIGAAVFISSTAAGYTLTEKRKTQTNVWFWILTLACGPVVTTAAWKLLLVAQQSTHLSILSWQLLSALFACSLVGAWAGARLRLKFENIVYNPA